MGKTISDAKVFTHPARLSRLALERAGVGIVLLDADERVMWTNDTFLRLCPEKSRWLGMPLEAMAPDLPAPNADFSSDVASWQPVSLSADEGRPSRDLLMTDHRLEGNPEGVSRVLTFIETAALSAGRSLESGREPALGLTSRRLFEDRLRHACARADRLDQGVAVLLARLDQRDELSERLGAETLGKLERRISRRLCQTLRQEDSITCSEPGHWRVLIEPPVTPDGLQAVTLRCQEAMDPPFMVDGRPLLLTLSVGIALYPEDGEAPETLWHSAQQALARSRQGGHAFFDRTLRRGVAERLAFRRGLQEALMCPDDHFQVVYQPQIDLRTGGCQGLEALVRWRHPKRGVLSPETFLPVVAEMEQLARLDRWVLARVINEHDEWQARASCLAGLKVAVNIDAALLEQSMFDQRPLDAFLRQQAEALDWLSLELEEGGFIARAQAQDHLLRRVMALGVGLVVNDMGRGPMELSRLANLPVSRVKLSPALVDTLAASSPRVRRSLEALTRCLEALRLESVMVGIETPEQLEVARALGAETVQGNLLCEPLASAQLEAWLAARAAPS